MNELTYKKAYDKIIQAYFRDEIKPMSAEFCFCGTLAPDSMWGSCFRKEKNNYPYSIEEYQRMEEPLLLSIGASKSGITGNWAVNWYKLHRIPNYEDKIFKGMCESLEVLKEIHRERGENVDDLPPLTKRQLQII